MGLFASVCCQSLSVATVRGFGAPSLNFVSNGGRAEGEERRESEGGGEGGAAARWSARKKAKENQEPSNR